MEKTMEREDRNSGVRELAKASIRAVEGEGNERKVILSFASEEPYTRWWGPEVLECTEEAVDLQRINDIGVLLFNHHRDDVIGKINRTWIENNKCYAEVEFDEDKDSEKIYQKVKSGTLKAVSVGYTVSNWEEVEAGKNSLSGRQTGPCSIAKRWEPNEISIVSVPADATVGVGRSQKQCIGSACFEEQIQINKNSLI